MDFRPPRTPNPPAKLVPDPGAAKENLKLLWLSCGKKDGLISISQGVHAYLKDKGVPHVWHVDGNGHDATHWGITYASSRKRSFARRRSRDEESKPCIVLKANMEAKTSFLGLASTVLGQFCHAQTNTPADDGKPATSDQPGEEHLTPLLLQHELVPCIRKTKTSLT